MKPNGIELEDYIAVKVAQTTTNNQTFTDVTTGIKPYGTWTIDDVFSAEEQQQLDTDKLYLMVYQNDHDNIDKITPIILHFMGLDLTKEKMHKFFISEDAGESFTPLIIPEYIMPNDIVDIQTPPKTNMSYLFNDIDDWRI